MDERWTLIISGSGARHGGQPTDVDALASAFLAKLRASGHQAIGALTASGSTFEVTPELKAFLPTESGELIEAPPEADPGREG